ncbi:hypothetical protein FS749_012906, partial [Ceratobasidium sp. UAMH 11750]
APFNRPAPPLTLVPPARSHPDAVLLGPLTVFYPPSPVVCRHPRLHVSTSRTQIYNDTQTYEDNAQTYNDNAVTYDDTWTCEDDRNEVRMYDEGDASVYDDSCSGYDNGRSTVYSSSGGRSDGYSSTRSEGYSSARCAAG